MWKVKTIFCSITNPKCVIKTMNTKSFHSTFGDWYTQCSSNPVNWISNIASKPKTLPSKRKILFVSTEIHNVLVKQLFTLFSLFLLSQAMLFCVCGVDALCFTLMLMLNGRQNRRVNWKLFQTTMKCSFWQTIVCVTIEYVELQKHARNKLSFTLKWSVKNEAFKYLIGLAEFFLSLSEYFFLMFTLFIESISKGLSFRKWNVDNNPSVGDICDIFQFRNLKICFTLLTRVHRSPPEVFFVLRL